MNRPNRESGFTLIEVIVALAILAVALGVLFHVISDALDRARENRNEMAATSLAQSLLARTGSEWPLQEGEHSGSYSNGFRWRLQVTHYGSAPDRDAWGAQGFAVKATIQWRDGNETRSRTLSTLRLAPLPAPPQ
jgi:general secretion pathway protein I